MTKYGRSIDINVSVSQNEEINKYVLVNILILYDLETDTIHLIQTYISNLVHTTRFCNEGQGIKA